MKNDNLFRVAVERRIVINALKIALVVGTILNVVNNGERLLGGLPINWWKFFLNFLVPYCVASYSAAKNEVQTRRAR